MSHEPDHSDEWIVSLIIGVFFALIIAVIIFIGKYVFAPLFAVANIYFVNYGRATAEVFTVTALVGMGLWFHYRSMKNALNNFCGRVEMFNKTVELYAVNKASDDKEIGTLKSKVREYQKVEAQLNRKINLLTEQTLNLQTEIERLKNPEEVARQEQVETQKQNDQDLKSIAESIRWGRT